MKLLEADCCLVYTRPLNHSKSSVWIATDLQAQSNHPQADKVVLQMVRWMEVCSAAGSSRDADMSCRVAESSFGGKLPSQ